MEDVNEIFADFAALFTGHLDDPSGDDIVHPDRLDRTALDGSLDSLTVVDTYLEYLHEHRPERMGQDWSRTVLRAGAYVGEAIRTAAERTYDWIDYDVFTAEYPDIRRLLGDRGLPVASVLSTGDGGFTLPLNKVIKYIANGSEDSVWFYAVAECQSSATKA
ncbi:hypothetical protein [Dactylosporangium sp. NPDC049140]|jgi:hypothetical protein|uniref:hypothetical protein n=1 Tax=Dactylosporangium sp. NPDC049140 TaxID=3155647 RepID=UPI0033E9ED28